MLMRKERCYAEIYNDLDGEAVNLFRVMQDQDAALRLVELLRLTPFARTEFALAYEPTADAIERARRLVIRSFMGHGSDAASIDKMGGFRANSNRSGTTPARDWVNFPDALELAVERLRGVIIENREACKVAGQHDSPSTLHYFDPPYMAETRSWQKTGRGLGNYRHELDRGGHARLLKFLRGLTGMVVLSGYPSSLYDDALKDWRRVECKALADGARPRIEVLWLNPACARALDRQHSGAHTPLFAGVAQ